MRDMNDSRSADSAAKDPVLVVDLDGTLVSTDMLFECFWSAFADDWRTPFAALWALTGGRAALKDALARRARVEVRRLPFNDPVLGYIRAWRGRGGRVALVTASDQRIAEQVADYLGLFDEVHGSDGRRNLKGPEKSLFLAERYGAGGFVYMGDAAADLAVWRVAARAVTVAAPPELRRRVEALGTAAEHLSAPVGRYQAHLRALRPNQWLKNILVFVPVLASHELDAGMFARAALAFVAFSLVASAVYVLNDLLDLDADRAHPRKRLRPFASGEVPIARGGIMATGLLLAGLLLSPPLGTGFLLVMAIYFSTTLAYSLALKRRIILDITTLAGLYTVRIVAGGVAAGLTLSVWLLAFSVFFFFALAAVKRQAELIDLARRDKNRADGRGYRVSDLPVVAGMAMASGYVSVLVLVLYLDSPAVRDLYGAPVLLWGICGVVAYWLSHVFIVTHRGGMHDDPLVYAVRDRHSQVCAGLVAGFALAAVLL